MSITEGAKFDIAKALTAMYRAVEGDDAVARERRNQIAHTCMQVRAVGMWPDDMDVPALPAAWNRQPVALTPNDGDDNGE